MKRFMARDGLHIAYNEWGADAPGIPVLLHHGFISHGQANWVPCGAVDALVAAKRRVVAIDARGHGESDKPLDPAAYGHPAMARDLMQLADILQLSAYDLVGYSMGAYVSLYVAAHDPRVRRLVIGGVGETATKPGEVAAVEAIAAALDADDPSTIANSVAAGFRAFADISGGDRRALAAVARAFRDLPFGLHQVGVPTLLLCGAGDSLATRPEVLVAALPNARFELLQGDHLGVFQEPRLVAALMEFLEAA